MIEKFENFKNVNENIEIDVTMNTTQEDIKSIVNLFYGKTITNITIENGGYITIHTAKKSLSIIPEYNQADSPTLRLEVFDKKQ